MNVLDLLRSDHEKVGQLFGELISSGVEGRRGLFARLEAELTVHSKAEEQIFYPAVPSGDISHARQEHADVANLLTALSSQDVETDTWLEGVKELKGKVEHHVEEEEAEIFSSAETLGEAKLEELGKRVEEFKQKI